MTNIPGKIKNAVIALLMAAALIQVYALWFSGGQIFSLFSLTIVKKAGEITQEAMESFIKPFRIGIGSGDSTFLFYSGDYALLPVKVKTDDIIAQAVMVGEAAKPISWNDIAGGVSVIYDFAAVMPLNDYARALCGVAAPGHILARNIQFDAIAVTGGNDGQRATVSFTLKSTGETVSYSVADPGTFSIPSGASEVVAGISHIIMKSDTGGILLIPAVGGEFSYAEVLRVFPYAEGGDILLSNVESYIDHFFGTPSQKWTRLEPYTFSDETTVVKYYSTNVMEYTNYVMSEDTGKSLLSAYAQAVGILNKDPSVENDYYLSSVAETENGYVLGFDYVLNNYPVELSNAKKEQMGIDNFLEVTVVNNSVSKYRRFVCAFDMSDETARASSTYEETLSQMGFAGGSEVSGVKRFSLSYLVYDEQSVRLFWVIETENGAVFTQPL